MDWSGIATLLGVFIGGAAPWLEAIVVIPAGIVAGMNPVLAFLAGTSGNLITVAIAAWFGERLRAWWRARRDRKAADRVVAAGAGGSATVATTQDEHEAAKRGKRAARIEAIATRWGMPALAVLGPLGLGTQASAIVAVGLGVSARTAFAWIGGATIAWGLIAAILATQGMAMLG
ncbi:small multi-drug export protein [Hoyosella sp. G463]|uniref:Small multi-drug export protein n=1 Tax=Lolliginicoccus lacisalsi TaxID=2742202 RepID=A0A927PL94_9ACTN|nr:small multi-drug export protein [Lolliginicoccus lacisalsi]MBD8506870.1 small multi-drug export protein [Lolliginicoccus lacisalsi]